MKKIVILFTVIFVGLYINGCNMEQNIQNKEDVAEITETEMVTTEEVKEEEKEKEEKEEKEEEKEIISKYILI